MARLDPTGVSRILSYIKTWVTTALGGKANSSHSHTKSQITDFPTIPSNTSQLTNDSGYITSSGSCNYANSAGSAGSATTAETVSTSVAADSSKALVYSSMADNDFCRINCGGSSNAGYLEIATADDGNEPIYVRQYTGVFSSVTRTITLLDGSGNTQFPGTVTAPTFSGNLNGNCSGSAGSVAWNNVSGRPTIPTKTSDLTNNSGFLTSHNPIDSSLSSTSTNAVQNKVVKSALDGKLAINTGSGIIERYGNGQYLYCQIATITITGGYVNFPIVLEISGRGMLFSTVQIVFENTSSTDPTISKFISDNYNYFYIKKTATSTWAVYVKYTGYWGSVIVHRASGVGLANSSISCTFTASDLSELPSGCTQVSNDLTTNGYRIYVD